MVKLKGIKTEVQDIIIDVDDKELMRAIRERIGVEDNVLNDKEDEIGYWRDESSERSNYCNWVWHRVSKNKKEIKVLQAIKVVEEYIGIF